MTAAEFIGYLQSAGIAAGPTLFMTLLWWLERDERKDAVRELREVSEKSIAAITEMKTFVELMSSIFRPNKGGGQWQP